jgi:hypothetical protein
LAVGFGSLPAVIAAGVDLVGLGLDGVSPTDFAFPIVSSIGVGYMADRKSEFKPLTDWLLSEQGQSALRDVGLITSR